MNRGLKTLRWIVVTLPVSAALCLPSLGDDKPMGSGICDSTVQRVVLTPSSTDSVRLVVDSMTRFELGDRGNPAARERMVAYLGGQFRMPGCDSEKLVRQLYERNATSARLTLESSPEHGYIVGFDSTCGRGVPCPDRDKQKGHDRAPASLCGRARVSLPACDTTCGFVMVYRGIQWAPLAGQGWIIVLRLQESVLIPVDSVMIWIS